MTTAYKTPLELATIASTSIPDWPSLKEGLALTVKGSVYLRSDSQFQQQTRLFNGSVKTDAALLVCPLDASDVSATIIFCNTHGLSPSVKGAGYGTAGWAVGGDVIMDMRNISGAKIDIPGSNGTPTPASDAGAAWPRMRPAPATAKFLQEPSPKVDSQTYTPPAASTQPCSPYIPSFASSPSLPAFTSWKSSFSPPPNPLFGGMSAPFSLDSMNVLAPPVPIHPHVLVTFGAGMTQRQVDIFSNEHPLHAKSQSGTSGTIPYHVPLAAHPAGTSVLLLGGFGFLSRLHGLCSDNLAEVEIVLADGSIVTVNETNHPDLWWAIRGAGPAFGIVTRYTAKAYPVASVYGGNLIYRYNKATAASLIKHFRDSVKNAPRELYANVILTAGPAGKDSLVVIQLCYIGQRERGKSFLDAILAWDGEKCLLNEVNEKSFLNQQDSVAQVLRGKGMGSTQDEESEFDAAHAEGRQWFIRSALVNSLPDSVIHDSVNQFSETPSGCTWLFELAGGRIPEFKDSCIPAEHREAQFTIVALHQWDIGLSDPRCKISAEEWITNTLGPHHPGGPIPSFLGRHEKPERIISCYGEANFERLKEVKKKYDPKNLFHHNFWPVCADGSIIDRASGPESQMVETRRRS